MDRPSWAIAAMLVQNYGPDAKARAAMLALHDPPEAAPAWCRVRRAIVELERTERGDAERVQ